MQQSRGDGLSAECASGRWTRADAHLLAALACVVFFTAQRLTGYMTLYLYKRVPYDYVVLAAHVLGGAALVAACTIGARAVPMRSRAVPLRRVVANHGWSVGSFFVLLLWWMCWPAWRPETNAGRVAGAAVFLGVMLLALRPFERAVARSPRATLWRAALPVALWQAYSLHWELGLNFLKDDLTVLRGGVQWDHVAADALGTLLGVLWAWRAARTK